MNRKYRDNVLDWADILNCEIKPLSRGNAPGMMYVEFGYIECPPVKDQITYMINMHELGHFAMGHTQGRPPKTNERLYFDNGVLHSEAEAWEWALNHSIYKVYRHDTRRFMWDTCLGSYYVSALYSGNRLDRLGNGNRHHVQFIWDRPDRYFTSVVGRIQGNMNGFRVIYRGSE